MPSIKNKFIVTGFTILLLIAATSAFAQAPTTPTSREYPYLYKSTRAMGMGGAYTAVGGTVDSIFYNPSGISSMPKDQGWEFDLLNLSAEAGKNTETFVNHLQDAFDTGDLNGDGSTDDDQLRATNDVLAAYRGKNLHARVSDFTAIGKNFEKVSFGMGAVGQVRLDAMAHQGFGPEGLLEMNADATYGGIGALSIAFTDNLAIGVNVKALKREAIVHDFTARELVDNQDNLDNYITDNLKKTGSAVGFDAGLTYKFAQGSWLKPSVGLSVLNIGDLDFGEAGTIPMTVNTGLAFNPTIPFFRSLIVGVDYVDVLNNYTQDKDFKKRLRMGAELQLFDKLLMGLKVRGGLYQGNPTYGLDLRLMFIDLQYVAYTEEIGAYAGQEKDKRQLVTLNIGW